MNLTDEKKVLFRDAVRYADIAKYKLLDLQVLPEFRKTLTEDQTEAIREYEEAFSKVLTVYQDLEAGRSE